MVFATFSVVSFYGTAILYRYSKPEVSAVANPDGDGNGYRVGLFERACRAGSVIRHSSPVFVRTPKYNVESGRDNWLQAAKKYKRKGGLLPYIELAFALYFVGAVYYAIRSNIYATIPFLLIFLLGYGYMAMMSLFQGRVRRLLNALRR